MRQASAHLRPSLISDRALLDLFTQGCIDHFEADKDDVTRAHRGVLLDRIECCKIDYHVKHVYKTYAGCWLRYDVSRMKMTIYNPQ